MESLSSHVPVLLLYMAQVPSREILAGLIAAIVVAVLLRRLRLRAIPSWLTGLAVGAVVVVVSLPNGGYPYMGGTIGDIRILISAQAAYQHFNQGYQEGRLECLSSPSECIPGPGYPTGAPRSLLQPVLSSLRDKSGYQRSFYPGPRPDSVPKTASPTSVEAWAYVAIPFIPGERPLCGDSTRRICWTNGSTPEVLDGQCVMQESQPEPSLTDRLRALVRPRPLEDPCVVMSIGN